MFFKIKEVLKLMQQSNFWQKVQAEETFLNVKIKTKDLKFVSTNISVSFLKMVSGNQNCQFKLKFGS